MEGTDGGLHTAVGGQRQGEKMYVGLRKSAYIYRYVCLYACVSVPCSDSLSTCFCLFVVVLFIYLFIFLFLFTCHVSISSIE